MTGARETDPSEWLYGIIPVEEALRVGRRRVLDLWMIPGERNPRLRALRELAKGVPVHVVPAWDLDRRSQGGRHQGVVARVGPFPWRDMDAILEIDPPLLVLEGIQDPQNLGAILRSAVALGAKGIMMEKRRSAPLSPVVAKAACGAVEHVNLCRVTNLPRAMEEAKRAGFWMVGTREDAESALWESDLPERVAVVVGGEGFGLRPIVSKACDLWVSIPCGGPIATLNASVAAGVVLYEIMRRREVGKTSKKTIDKPPSGS